MLTRCQTLFEALFMNCIFDLYTLRGGILYYPSFIDKGAERFTHLPKVTQVACGRARTQTQIVWLEISCSPSTGVPLRRISKSMWELHMQTTYIANIIKDVWVVVR